MTGSVASTSTPSAEQDNEEKKDDRAEDGADDCADEDCVAMSRAGAACRCGTCRR